MQIYLLANGHVTNGERRHWSRAASFKWQQKQQAIAFSSFSKDGRDNCKFAECFKCSR